jgi:hypothetical protein
VVFKKGYSRNYYEHTPGQLIGSIDELAQHLIGVEYGRLRVVMALIVRISREHKACGIENDEDTGVLCQSYPLDHGLKEISGRGAIDPAEDLIGLKGADGFVLPGQPLD